MTKSKPKRRKGRRPDPETMKRQDAFLNLMVRSPAQLLREKRAREREEAIDRERTRIFDRLRRCPAVFVLHLSGKGTRVERVDLHNEDRLSELALERAEAQYRRGR